MVKTKEIMKDFDYKEMIYGVHRKREVLMQGKYKDYQFYILNLGCFPTAYIEIPKKHKYYRTDYDEIDYDFSVHGGLTYSDDFLDITDKETIKNSWFIGWDYAHYGDYVGYKELYLMPPIAIEQKEWTTEEILEDVINCIDELIKCEV